MGSGGPQGSGRTNAGGHKRPHRSAPRVVHGGGPYGGGSTPSPRRRQQTSRAVARTPVKPYRRPKRVVHGGGPSGTGRIRPAKRYSRPSAKQRNAHIIAKVGRSVGASKKQILAALATARVESGLLNLHHGDRDSLGLFQQRPSQGWGSAKQVTNPSHAAKQFFKAAKVSDSKGLSAGALAQKVQRSAYPDRYGRQVGKAKKDLAKGATQPYHSADPELRFEPGVHPGPTRYQKRKLKRQFGSQRMENQRWQLEHQHFDNAARRRYYKQMRRKMGGGEGGGRKLGGGKPPLPYGVSKA